MTVQAAQGMPNLEGAHQALEEGTREALSTLTEAIRAASAFERVRAQLSKLALENRQLREQLGGGVATSPNELEAIALPEAIGKPSTPAGECAVFDEVGGFTLPNALEGFTKPPQIRPPSRDAWGREAADMRTRSGDSMNLPGQMEPEEDRLSTIQQEGAEAKVPQKFSPQVEQSLKARMRASMANGAGASLAARAGLDYTKDAGVPHANNPRRLFPDKTELMERVQENLSTPQYKVTNFYWETGIAQEVARNSIFENLTLSVIILNSIWIAIDTDYNTTPMDPEVGFIVVENLFCAYFFFEVVVRFCAFAEKKNCIKSYWFIFDAVLVTVAVLETWVMVLAGHVTGVSLASLTGRSSAMLRLLRMARLARTARMARLLRAVPEVMIMFKGVVVASKAVICTSFVLALILYVFALFFRQLTMGSELGETHFRSVPSTMSTLLLRGTLPDIGDFVHDLSDVHMLLGWLGLGFALVTILVVLNMLAGVLVNVVLIVADLEKEEADAMFVRNALGVILSIADSDGDKKVSKQEFENLLVNPEATALLKQVGVDVMGLVELADFLYDSGDDSGEGLLFEDFFKLVLKLRGSKSATVKDIVEMRKFLVTEFTALEQNLVDRITNTTTESRNAVRRSTAEHGTGHAAEGHMSQLF